MLVASLALGLYGLLACVTRMCDQRCASLPVFSYPTGTSVLSIFFGLALACIFVYSFFQVIMMAKVRLVSSFVRVPFLPLLPSYCTVLHNRYKLYLFLFENAIRCSSIRSNTSPECRVHFGLVTVILIVRTWAMMLYCPPLLPEAYATNEVEALFTHFKEIITCNGE